MSQRRLLAFALVMRARSERGYCMLVDQNLIGARTFALIATVWRSNCKNGCRTREPRAAHLRDRKPRAAALCRAEVL